MRMASRVSERGWWDFVAVDVMPDSRGDADEFLE
jgi:hypothetical protein